MSHIRKNKKPLFTIGENVEIKTIGLENVVINSIEYIPYRGYRHNLDQCQETFSPKIPRSQPPLGMQTKR